MLRGSRVREGYHRPMLNMEGQSKRAMGWEKAALFPVSVAQGQGHSWLPHSSSLPTSIAFSLMFLLLVIVHSCLLPSDQEGPWGWILISLCVYVHTLRCAHMCGGQSLMASVFPHCLPLYVLSQGFPLNLELTDWPGWLAGSDTMLFKAIP